MGRTDPITGQALTSLQLIPNRTLSQTIRAYAAAVGLRPKLRGTAELRRAVSRAMTLGDARGASGARKPRSQRPRR